MNEKIEGCRTFEEDDDNLLSLWVKVFLLDRFRSILDLSVQMIIILPCQSYLFMFSNLVGSFQTPRFVESIESFIWHLIWSKSMFVYMLS